MEKEVKLFDKRFVYFMWDDGLKGKEGFFADSIDVLNYNIEDCDDNRLGKVSFSNRDDFPFYVYGGLYRFFYYDPNYEVKRAYYKEGKQIQVAYKGANNWVDCDEPEWVDGCQFRIKPDCTCEKKTFRPFKDCDELVKFWTEKYQSVARPANTMPLIWVRKKEGARRSVKENNVVLITGFDSDTGGWGSCVFLEDVWIDLKELYDDYEFLDRKPCGVKEE